MLVNYNKKTKVQNLAKAIKNTTKPGYNTNPRGMSAFDFDETLIIDGENFIIATKGDDTVKISSGDWPIVGPKYTKDGYSFNFDDFVNVRGGVDGPLLKKFKSRLKRYGAANTFVLTARPQEAAPAIYGWLKSKGLEIPMKNITGLASSLGESKAEWMLEKFAEGYNDMYFVDDALPNYEAVKDAMSQLDIKSNVQLAKVNFSKKSKAEQTILNSFDIKGETNLARVNFNKKNAASIDALMDDAERSSIDSRRTNEMLNRKDNTFGTEEEVSTAKAKRLGQHKKRGFINLAAGAEDFKGLLYDMLGDDKQGEADMAFFQDALLDPLNRGERAVATKRQELIGGYELIKKKHLKTHAKIGQPLPNAPTFTYGHAVRVQIWNEMGLDIPGLSIDEQAMMIDVILNDPELSDYAMDLEDIFHGDYPSPGMHWTAGTVASDMVDSTKRANRKNLLNEFITNKNEVFSEANLNKMEAIYGRDWRIAMEDILYRIENGTNRSMGQDGTGAKWNNWVNASVGSIMFLNMRSATLQLLSTVNYINHEDNNVFAAGKALANQKQYWADWSLIWNSDFLKQRRSGLQTDIAQQELASHVEGAKNKAKAAISFLLKKGFTPTQLADSFAIASGGSTFYRNRTNAYVKSGMPLAEAEAKAFTDFQDQTEEAQQSSRPDRVSMQQASGIGRLLLAFQNTPMQYARIIKKSMMDIQAGRGNATSHMSRIAWYAGVQAAIFGTLQSGLFMNLFDDEEDLLAMTPEQLEKYEKRKGEKLDQTTGTMWKGLLNGTGISGRVITTLYDIATVSAEEIEKGWKGDDNKVVRAGTGISPSIGSKLSKLTKAVKTLRTNKKAMESMSLTEYQHPAYEALSLGTESLLNIPLHRAYVKLDNIASIFDAENTAMQKILLAIGWNPYALDISSSTWERRGEAKQETKDRDKSEKKKNKVSKPTKNDMNPFAKPSKKRNKQGSSSWMDNPTAAKAINISPKEAEAALSGSGSFRCRNITMSGVQCKNLTNNKSKLCYIHD